MKFEQKYKGVSRIPSGKGFSISLSEADIKSEKSASPEPPKEISYEGQGGKDYENRPEDAINPEGQGGKDYSDYEDSMSRKASPFNHRDKTGKPIFKSSAAPVTKQTDFVSALGKSMVQAGEITQKKANILSAFCNRQKL